MPQTRKQNRLSLRKHYQAHPEYYRTRNRRRQAKFKEIIQREKAVPCTDCGRQFASIAMDFHHRDPTTKKFNIAHTASAPSLEALLMEIAKCDVLCAVCHRLRKLQE